PPRRRTRRTTAAPAGRLHDPRRTARETMRMHGEPSTLFWRRRRLRVRPLILILDVSGSMADYSRNLLQFAYSAAQATTRVEVFCFGTRLTRITRALERRRVEDAMGPARDLPGRDRGDLFRRAGPRRPAGAGDRDGTAGPAVPQGGLGEPAQGR